MKKTKEFEPGTIIEISADNKPYIKDLMEKVESLELGFEVLADLLRKSQTRLWDEVHRVYPESVGLRATLKNDEGNIKLIIGCKE